MDTCYTYRFCSGSDSRLRVHPAFLWSLNSSPVSAGNTSSESVFVDCYSCLCVYICDVLEGIIKQNSENKHEENAQEWQPMISSVSGARLV